MTKKGQRKATPEEAAAKALGRQLLEARQAAGLTQQDLAKRLGVSQSWIVRIEKHGIDVTLATLRRYVKALGEGFERVVEVRRPEQQKEPIAYPSASP